MLALIDLHHCFVNNFSFRWMQGNGLYTKCIHYFVSDLVYYRERHLRAIQGEPYGFSKGSRLNAPHKFRRGCTGWVNEGQD